MNNRYIDALIARRLFDLPVVSLRWPCVLDHETGEWMTLATVDARSASDLADTSFQPVYQNTWGSEYPLLVSHYTSNAADDLSVHQHITKHWKQGYISYYMGALDCRLSNRSNYYPINSLYAMLHYQTGDYSHAALSALRLMRSLGVRK